MPDILRVMAVRSSSPDHSADRFERIYHDNREAVLAYALRRTTEGLAQDVAAETFLVAWRRIESVPADPLPWLLGVARRTIANQRRGAARAGALRDRLAAEHVPPAGPSEDTLGVLEAYATLSPADQELLALVAWEGLRTGQAATVLGTTPLAARVRLHRAKRRLATALDAAGRAPVSTPLRLAEPTAKEVP
jgi:RNA polymerase sigma-70 factor (ECF subfamily)